MERYSLLKNEINKGIAIDEKSGVVLQGWSPNNLRRLVIGPTFALVQYHTTNSTYKKLIELVDFRSNYNKDINQLISEPSQYKTLLKVLADGRICSSIEEIFFVEDNYYPTLMNADMNINQLGTNEANVASRFSRLVHVSSIRGIQPQTIAEILNATKDANTLAIDFMHEKGVRQNIHTVAEPHKDDWWKNYRLRPKYYSMDTQTLKRIFEGVEQHYQEIERKNQYLETELKYVKEELDTNLPKILLLTKTYRDTEAKAESIFKNVSIISKAEWGSTLHAPNMRKHIKKNFYQRPDFILDIRSIDFNALVNVVAKVYPDKVEEVKEVVTYYREHIFNEVLPSEEEYKRQSNKSAVKQSIKDLTMLAKVLVTLQVKETYLAYAKYLTRNTPSQAKFYFDLLNPQPINLRYTRSISEYCNTFMDEGYSAEAFNLTEAKLILAEEFNLKVKLEEATRLLQALSSAT